MQNIDANAQFTCWGGSHMQNAGGDIVISLESLSYMGFYEVVKNSFLIFQSDKNTSTNSLHNTNNSTFNFYYHPEFFDQNQTRHREQKSCAARFCQIWFCLSVVSSMDGK